MSHLGLCAIVVAVSEILFPGTSVGLVEPADSTYHGFVAQVVVRNCMILSSSSKEGFVLFAGVVLNWHYV